MDRLSTIRWRDDLHLLVREVQRRRPTLFSSVSDSQFLAAADRLERRLPELNDDAATAQMSRLISLIDLRPLSPARPPVLRRRASWRLPLRVYDFADGIFVTDAFGPHRRAIGHRLTAISGTPIEQVTAALDPLTSRDDMHAPCRTLPLHLVSTSVLYGLGILPDRRSAEVTLAAPHGGTRTHRLRAMAPAFYDRWQRGRLGGLPHRGDQMYLRDPWSPFWFDADATAGVVYIQANRPLSRAALEQALVRLDAAAGEPAIVVVDFRMNEGDDPAAWQPLASHLRATPRFQDPCRILVISSGAAQRRLAAAITAATNAINLREAGGSPPLSIGDARPIVLPNTGIAVHMSGLYWRRTSEKTSRKRTFLLKSHDFFSGHDPAMQAVRELFGSTSLTAVI